MEATLIEKKTVEQALSYKGDRSPRERVQVEKRGRHRTEPGSTLRFRAWAEEEEHQR